MSVNYNLATLNNRLQQVVNAIDGGGSNGFMRLLDGSGNILSSFTLAFPSGTVSGGVLAFSGLSLIDPSAAASGTAAAARIEDSTGGVVVSGLTVGGTASSDIVMSTTSIIVGQTVALTAATITGN